MQEPFIPSEAPNESNVFIKSASYRTASAVSLLPIGDPRRQSKYPALRRVASLIRVYAIILVLATNALFILFLVRSEYYQALIVLSIGLLVYCFLTAFAEMIHVFVDIEFNTRIIGNYLSGDVEDVH